MTTPRYPSATNTFVPQATGQAIAFVRDPKKFKLNRYVQIIKMDEPIGLYAYLDPDQPTRVLDDSDYVWEDGDYRPKGKWNQASFLWNEVAPKRRAYPYTLGEQIVDTPKGWNPRAFYDAMILSQAMTNKTKRVISLLETTGSWGSSTASATALNGGAGNWTSASGDPTSGNYLAIKKSLLAAARFINLATNSVVGIEDLRLVISPELAITMANTDEINSFLRNNAYGLPQVRGGVPGQNALWGLPDQYAGIEIVVEDASFVNSNALTAGTAATVSTTFGSGQKVYCKSNTSAVLMSRPGGLDGDYGAPSFSTLQLYYYKYEMAVEARHNSWHKLYEASVVDHFKEILAAAPSGFLITATM